MAIYGNFYDVKNQINLSRFKLAFEYLEKVLKICSMEHKRLVNHSLGTFEKYILDDSNFALEQVYESKKRNECFFESHKNYIDIQFILSGSEYIETSSVKNLTVSTSYNKENDLIKYCDTNNSSKLLLKSCDVAIFYPEDGHMPCIQVDKSAKVIKTVVKVKV